MSKNAIAALRRAALPPLKADSPEEVFRVVESFSRANRPADVHHWFVGLVLQNERGLASHEKHIKRSYAELINAYTRPKHATKDSVREASNLLNTMIAHSNLKPSLVTYTHLLRGYAETSDIASCKLVLEKLKFMGHSPDLPFYTTLLRAYVRAGDTSSATSLHSHLKHTHFPLDTRYYNALIHMHSKRQDLSAMMSLYEEMTLVAPPDEHTFTTLIDAFIKSGETRLAVF
ncbi:hypothetical protein HDU98_011914, partial [Podochytrium sp. JEL0797]